jgi:hypothetical protein
MIFKMSICFGNNGIKNMHLVVKKDGGYEIDDPKKEIKFKK